MAEPVNLRLRRKQKARDAAAEAAAENRARYGRPKAERIRYAAENARAGAELDSKKISE